MPDVIAHGLKCCNRGGPVAGHEGNTFVNLVKHVTLNQHGLKLAPDAKRQRMIYERQLDSVLLLPCDGHYLACLLRFPLCLGSQPMGPAKDSLEHEGAQQRQVMGPSSRFCPSTPEAQARKWKACAGSIAPFEEARSASSSWTIHIESTHTYRMEASGPTTRRAL